jgi:hypothetical protein
MSAQEEFTTFQISKALEIKYGRLREWIDRRYIEPSIHKAQRQGQKTLFNRIDAYMIKLFDYLLARGFSREEAARKSYSLQVDAPEVLSMVYIAFYRQEGIDTGLCMFIPTKDVHLTLFGKTPDGKEGEFDDVLIVNFKKIRDQVDQALL